MLGSSIVAGWLWGNAGAAATVDAGAVFALAAMLLPKFSR
jgi:hypothetical protein